jgi:hypothetical protein
MVGDSCYVQPVDDVNAASRDQRMSRGTYLAEIYRGVYGKFGERVRLAVPIQ